MDDERTAFGRVAFLGLGLMGTPIAARLAAAGVDLRVWNRTPGKVAPAVEAGAKAFPAPRDACDGVDVVFLCLTDHRAVEDVLFGDEGIGSHLAPDVLVIDLSTIGPQPTREFAARLFELAGAHWVDSPVSGGVAGASAGTLIALVGGEPAQIRRASPLLRRFTRAINPMGGIGAGQAAKLCNQLIVAANIVAITEAMALAKANGIDPALLPPALAGGWADSLPLQIIGPRLAARQTEPRIGAIGTFAKDIAAILASAASAQLPLTHAAAAIYEAALAEGLGDSDIGMLGVCP